MRKDYKVQIVRRGEIIVRADSIEEAATMAARFGYHSFEWDDKYDIHAEVVQSSGEKHVDKPSAHSKGFRQKQKKKKRSQRYCPDEFPEEIPF